MFMTKTTKDIRPKDIFSFLVFSPIILGSLANRKGLLIIIHLASFPP